MEQPQFLDQVAARLGRPRRHASQIVKLNYRTNPWDSYCEGKTADDFCRIFQEALTSQSAKVIVVTDRNQMYEELQTVLEKGAVKRVAIWDDPRLNDLQLESFFAEQGIACTRWSGENDQRQLTMQVEASQLGITWADAACAETGTIVLQNRAGKGRLVSLLPQTHLVFVKKEQIHARWSGIMQEMHRMTETNTLPSYTNFISGPTTSADIALEIVKGVHGPKHLVVMVVDF
ncbi:LutC/YkgG family protein [Effusibacillus dendaii]|uniref:Lactate utilization protein C n=1 Tax=Effusibacillus dendaii TaxID=2743772 RepID=A0A7I8D679_9BACL|nr:lactate utilization protein C [Effusibacillus dendaii]BCJ85497.1 lactate utilization protein C [Effusibacillus dendaii]